MISTIVSRLVILVFGTLYPAYASYKAVRTKNVKEYVKWMMYWIVFALFTCAETFTDVFLSWFPFYYEIKIILVLWLLSPATKGSSILYRKFVHPMLSRREQEIDDYIAKAKEQGYHTVLNLGTKGVNYATTVIMQTAIKGGGGIVNQLRKSYSLSDLTDDIDSRADSRGLQALSDEASDVVDPRHVRRRHSPRRSASGSSRVDMYFPEVDIRPGPALGHVRSTEDVSSGYSSAEPLYVGQPPKLEAREGLVRTASVGGTSRPRTRTTRTSLNTKKTTLPEDSEESESDSEVTVIQQVSKTLRIKRTSIIPEDSESSGNEFVDTIGFPAENIPIKVQKYIDLSIPSNEPAQETNVDVVEPDKIEIVTESSQKMEAVVEVQITKEPSVDIFEDTIETNDSKIETNDNKIETNDNKIETNDNTDNKIVSTEKVPVESISSTSTDIDSVSLTSNFLRGGKYNKHIAPVPPENKEIVPEIQTEPESEPLNKNIPEPEIIFSKPETLKQLIEKQTNLDEKAEYSNLNLEISEKTNFADKLEIPEVSSAQNSESETHSIKATLVLKPGIIKNVGPSTEDKTQIFVSQSPKAKRKTKSKHDSPISRLMMLPKKIFGNKHSSDESLKDKRKSWNPDTRSLTPSSIEDLKSKSDTEDLYEPINYLGEEKKTVSAAELRHEENKMILRTLSHSPKQYRRRNKEDYEYEDSD